MQHRSFVINLWFFKIVNYLFARKVRMVWVYFFIDKYGKKEKKPQPDNKPSQTEEAAPVGISDNY